MCHKKDNMDYTCKYLISNGVLIDTHVSMEDHIDDDARKEEEHVAAQHPMVLSRQACKKHCKKHYNEILLLIITNHINLKKNVIVVDSLCKSLHTVSTQQGGECNRR